MRVIALLTVLLLMPVAQAADLSQDNNVLYGLRTSGSYMVSPDPADPSDGGNWGSALGGVVGSPYASGGREWAMGMLRPDGPVVELDPEGSVLVRFSIGGGINEAAKGKAGWELLQDGAVAISGSLKDFTFYGDDEQELTWDVPAGIDRLDPSVLSFRVYTAETVGSGSRLNLDHGAMTVTLPVIGGGAAEVPLEVIAETLESPVVDHIFDNATTASYLYNFTAENGFGLVDMAINGTGNATAKLVDAAGVELFNGTIATGITEYQNFTAGAWTLSIEYEEFVGSFAFEFLDGHSVQNEAEEAAPPEEAEEIDGNATEEDVTDAPADDQESPGAPMVALMAALAAIVVVRRRS